MAADRALHPLHWPRSSARRHFHRNYDANQFRSMAIASRHQGRIKLQRVTRCGESSGVRSDRTIETRLDFLETEIHKWITKGKEEAVQIATDLVKREEQSRLSADTEFRKHLEVTGRLSLIAAVWLSIGVILSTASAVIGAMLHCLFRS
jgi:hypothetical protein